MWSWRGSPARWRTPPACASCGCWPGACACGQIVLDLPLAQATVSQHLKVLKDAGIIHGQVDGPRVCYRLDPGALKRVKELVRGL